MSTILGLCYGHHGSACIVKDGKLIGAISTERITGNKFCWGVTNETLDYLFNFTSVSLKDIDYIGVSDWNVEFTQGTIKVKQNGEYIDCLWNTVYDNTLLDLEVELRGETFPGYYIGHQLSHAAASYYTSPYDKSYCFTMDASGAKHKNNSLVAYGEGNKLTSLYCPGLMIGVAYGFFTEYIALGSQMLKAGSTMALAGYGTVIQRVKDNIDEYVKGCFFSANADYHRWYTEILWNDLSDNKPYFEWGSDTSNIEQVQNIAASIQYIFQNAILKCVQDIDSKGVINICLGGGSMLNCTANSLVLTESKFDNVYLFPGCGDDGLAVGVALYIAHHILDESRYNYLDKDICYLGADKSNGVEPDYKYLAKELSEGKVVAWCNGRSEYGPRALGNRSILADPRDYTNREKINFEIKTREWFRPLAPIVMEEYSKDWFDFPTKSSFMLHTAPIKDPDSIPAVNHVDGTARHQTVNEETNPHMYRLLKEFNAITGVPILLNTSLNINGHPMVETDEDAMEFFNLNKVDILVLNGEVHNK